MARQKPGHRKTKRPAAARPAKAAAPVKPAQIVVDIPRGDYQKLIGKRLRAMRLAKGLSPGELAGLVRERGQKLSDDTVGNYENGHSNMKLVTLREMTHVLGAQLTDLIEDRTVFDYGSGRSANAADRDRLMGILPRLDATSLRLVAEYAESFATSLEPRKVA